MQRNNSINLRPDIRIFDNTLRDGEQTPGTVFSKKDKLDIVKALYGCGILDAEVGFPASSESERDSIRNVVRAALPIRLSGLCRLSKDDINHAVSCGLKYITLFLPGSRIYIEKNLKLKYSKITEVIKETVAYAVSKNINVKFSCENASRIQLETLLRYYKAAIDVGAYIISFPDTSGVMIPTDMYQCVKTLRGELKCEISAHCHNDLGLATANTLAAAEAGALELQVCVNGLGERAGNAPLEEVVMTLITQYGYDLKMDLSSLHTLSDLVYERSGLTPPFNKPIFGQNVFKHESAIHANAILRGENLYEPFPPSLVNRTHEVVLGKHSGLASIEYYLKSILNVQLNRSDMKKVLEKVKATSETKIPVKLDKILEDCGFKKK